MKLFTAGPVACFPEVLKAMSTQMFSHRSTEYQEIHMETVELLKDFLETKQNVILFPSSGTGFMEASIRNAVTIDGKVLVTIIGAFGERYYEVVESNGRIGVRLESELGDPVDLEDLKAALDSDVDIEAVTVTYNETSTGVLNPLKDIAAIVKRKGKLLFVDAVSAMGAADIKFDEWKIDIIFGSSQKAFGIPPGLAFGAVSDEILEISSKMSNKGWYFDFNLYIDYQESKHSTPTTPPIPQILGLNVILKKIRDMGKYNWLKMYEERASYIRKRIMEYGLRILAKEGYESPTITVVFAPNGLTGPEIYNKMREHGFELAMGYGKLKRDTFRIGHMGDISYNDIDDMLDTLYSILKQKP
jgi:aspartate aminotransferase-like enzyme